MIARLRLTLRTDDLQFCIQFRISQLKPSVTYLDDHLYAFIPICSTDIMRVKDYILTHLKIRNPELPEILLC